MTYALCLTVLAFGYGFCAQASTLPELLPRAWFAIGAFETLAECEQVNRGLRASGAYRTIEPCGEY